MLLTVDVGNTNIVLGVFRDNSLEDVFRVSTDPKKTAQEYSVLFRKLIPHWRKLKGVAISSVVPPINEILYQVCREYLYLEPFVVNEKCDLGISLSVDFPEKIGADRLVNAAAAYYLYGGPIIIIDLGTSTTCCAVSAEGYFLGGVILPGIGISMEALFKSASKLPRVELVRPPRVIGTNTVNSLQAGIYYGYVGMMDGLIGRFLKEIGKESLVVATGGFSEVLSHDSMYIKEIVPELTLEGLRLLYLKGNKYV